ncbi:unnamed protein product [Orchesella dallaii]|uniref:Uncharacterized protein n=1 Tax=Orchesella dallaii TaxID=48710 RepID=A0ABP1QJK7_9HEXA
MNPSPEIQNKVQKRYAFDDLLQFVGEAYNATVTTNFTTHNVVAFISATDSEVGKETTNFHPVNEPWTLEQIQELEKGTDIGKIAHNIPSILKSLDFGSILTRKLLTGLSENLLDKELDNCVSVYKTHQKLKEVNQPRNDAARVQRTGGVAPPKTLEQSVCTLYMTGNLDCIKDVISKEDGKAPGNAEPNSQGMQYESNDVDDDDKEGWETEDDEDNDNEDAVILSQFGNKLHLNKPEEEKKISCPVKSDPQRSGNTLLTRAEEKITPIRNNPKTGFKKKKNGPVSSWFPTSGPSISSSGSQCGHSMAVVDGRKRSVAAPTVPVVRARKVKRTEATTTLTAGQRKIRRAEVDTEQEKVNRDAVNAEGDE